ncbi:MAG: DUF4105 domain-containing protein [Bacteroidota bacterium]
MFRKVACLLLVLLSLSAAAQTDTSHLRISLITCGPGNNEIYEVFGHTAIRIVDSQQQTDMVYNYGTFSYGPGFELQFMRGKLLYSLGVYPYREFVPEYVNAGRRMEEQVLLLDDGQKNDIQSYLEWNAQPENRDYKYDFFFDNCATRIRDIFPKVFNPGFVFARTIPQDSKITFRDIINRYFYRTHGERVGCNLLLGSKIDKVMTNEDIMFLPDYLRDGVGGATSKGRRIATPVVTLLAGNPPPPAGFNWVMLLTSALAVLTIAGLCVPSLRGLGRFMSMFLLFITGLLGCLMLVMWLATDHQGCSNNFNVLWMLPTNIIIAFANPKGKGKYAIIGIILIIVSLILHLVNVQGLVIEFLPLMLALLFIFGTIYRRTTQTS